MLEGESQATLERQLVLFHGERALPDLASNIKCGNSLIGPDFYEGEGQQPMLFDDEEKYRINVFDWNAGFPEIMQAGGFDAVIGNPPYIRVRYFKNWYPEQIEYLERSYRCATHVWDIYLLMLERALGILRASGIASFIIPIQTLHQPNCESIRKLLLTESAIASVVDLSRIKVFEGAIVKNCILTFAKPAVSANLISILFPDSPEGLQSDALSTWPQARVFANPGHSLKLDLMSPKMELCEKILSKSWRLDQLCYV